MAARGRAILGDVGFKTLTAAYCQSSAYVEQLAGDPQAAERELRSGYGILEQMGEKGYLSTVAAELARALYEQGDFAGSERFSRISEELGSTDDLATQVEWRSSRAKVLARRGEWDVAVTLAEEAVRLSAETDYLDLQGDTFRDLAEVYVLCGRPGEAVSPGREALRCYERKGNMVSATSTRDLMSRLASAPQPSS